MNDAEHASDPTTSLTRRRWLWRIAASTAALGLGCRAPHSGAAAETTTGATARGATAQAFLAAVRRGDLAEVRERLTAAPALAALRDEHGRSAFVLAHLEGRIEIAAELRAHLAEPDLVESVLAQDWERVARLAEAQPAGVDVAHPIGGTPLWAGARCGTPDLYRLRSLGCDPDARPAGGDGTTPARAAMDCPDATAALLGATDLLGNGGDPNAAQRRGDTILHGAVRARSSPLVRLAVRKGSDIGARDVDGRTAPELARELGWHEGEALLRGHPAIARDHRTSRLAYDASRAPIRLVDLSDVPRARQSEVTGASHVQLERVRALLAADPRLVFSVSSDAELAIEACGHTGRRDIIRLHLDHGAPLSLPTAISLGDLDHARFLLDEDPLRVHERGPHDFALMWYASIGGGSVEAAELLLERGVPVDQESTGDTALHWAARSGQLDLIAFLAARGARLDAVGHKWDRAGVTPLQVALAAGRTEAARLLRDLGARG